MGQYRLRKTQLKGEIVIPSSKSQTMRAILFAMLAKGKSVVHRFLPSTDTNAMIDACRLFGAPISIAKDLLEIEGIDGNVQGTEDVIFSANSGIVLRFCSAIGALATRPVVITGDYSIRHQRPMRPLLDGLAALGASCVSMRGDGYAPVIIQGPITSGKTTIDGQDSQPISALLIASAFVEGSVEITVQNPGEKPWIALTLDWFDKRGITYENHNFEHYRVVGKNRYEGFEYHVPGDFSSAAFPIAAALITQSEITLKNIDMADVQGDKELIYIFIQMGARIDIDDATKSIHVKKSPELHGCVIDANNFIDAVTILATVACFAEGETHIRNVAVARTKECNRIECIVEELKKMGADITETEDGLYIRKSSLTGAHVYSYNDHRMAMSLAVAGMGAEGETAVSSIECVTKTFPSFVQDFTKLGGMIQELP